MPSLINYFKYLRTAYLKPSCPYCLFPLDKQANYWCCACLEQIVTPASEHKEVIHRCPCCGLQTMIKNSPCDQCLKEPPIWNRLYCIANYNSELQQLIHQYKYQKKIILAPILAKLLASQIKLRISESNYAIKDLIPKKPIIKTAPLLIPVPLYWKRQFSRGFNQSDYLSFFLAKELHLVSNNQLILRSRHTPPQQELNQKDRQKNLVGAFTFNKKNLFTESLPAHVAIVDDVVTTGGTINELTKLLKQQGVEKVDVYCLARTIFSHEHGSNHNTK